MDFLLRNNILNFLYNIHHKGLCSSIDLDKMLDVDIDVNIV